MSNQTELIFSGLLENNPTKIGITVLAAMLTLLCGGLSFGAVWYDLHGFDRYRTVINRIPTAMSLTCLCGITTMEVVEMLIFYTGPFSPNFCLINIIFKNSVKTNAILLTDFLVVTRYIFIVCIKNPAALDDRFWTVLISVWCLGFSVLFNAVFFSLPGLKPISFYICSNADPGFDSRSSRIANVVVEVASFALHGVLNIKIAVYKRANNFETDPTTTTPTYFASNAVGFLIIASHSLLNNKIASLPHQALNSYPNYIYVYLYALVGPAVLGIVILMIYYFKNVALRQYFYKHLSKLCVSPRSVFR